MKYTRRLSLTTATLIMACGLSFTAHSQAGPLQAADLNSPGDKLLTIDTNIGLEFLDVSATSMVGFNDTLLTPFVTEQGFRFATRDEFVQLLTDAGFTDFSGNFNTTDQAAAENLLSNFLGETIPPGQPFSLDGPGTQFDANISDGFYSFATLASTPAGFVNVVGVDYQSAALGQAAQDQTRVLLSLNQVPLGASPPIVGGLLVRQATVSPVPEPAELWLMGLGLGLLGFVSRRRQRRSQRPQPTQLGLLPLRLAS